MIHAAANLAYSGVAILLVEQNARMALGMADRGYVMERGSVALEGRAADLVDDDRVGAAYLGVTPAAGPA